MVTVDNIMVEEFVNSICDLEHTDSEGCSVCDTNTTKRHTHKAKFKAAIPLNAKISCIEDDSDSDDGCGRFDLLKIAGDKTLSAVDGDVNTVTNGGITETKDTESGNVVYEKGMSVTDFLRKNPEIRDKEGLLEYFSEDTILKAIRVGAIMYMHGKIIL